MEVQASIHGNPQETESGKAKKAELKENGSPDIFEKLGWSQHITINLDLSTYHVSWLNSSSESCSKHYGPSDMVK